MPKEEIIEGLKAAIIKGESLEKAMMSFYNAGYSKEDIEQAAGSLVQTPIRPQKPIQTMQNSQQPISIRQLPPPTQKPLPPPIQQTQKPLVIPNLTPLELQPKPLLQQDSPVVQRVSEYGYGKKPSKKGTLVTFVLVLLLLLLLGILVSLILFKEELTNFFSNLIWGSLI